MADLRGFAQGLSIGRDFSEPIANGLIRGAELQEAMRRRQFLETLQAAEFRQRQKEFEAQLARDEFGKAKFGTELSMTPGFIPQNAPTMPRTASDLTPLPGGGYFSRNVANQEGINAQAQEILARNELERKLAQPQIDEQNRIAGIALSPAPIDTQMFASGGRVSPMDAISAMQLRGPTLKPTDQSGAVPGKKLHGPTFVEGGKTYGTFIYPDNSVRQEEIPGPERTGKATPAKLSEGERNLLLSAGNQKYALRQATENYDKLSKTPISGPANTLGLIPGANPLLRSSVGPLPAFANSINNLVGYGSRGLSSFNTESKANLFNLARALQGAGVLTEQDVKRMEEIAPVGSQGREQFMGSVTGIANVMSNRIMAFLEMNQNRLSTDEKQVLEGVLTELQSVSSGQANDGTQAQSGITARTGRVIQPKPAE